MTRDKLYETLQRYAKSQGMELNNDRDFVLDIISGLLKNEERYGYRSCPCRLGTGISDRDEDIICPCRYRDDDVREYGACYCSLYVSPSWNEGKTPHAIVPERRPLRR
ncbi:MAG TPA: ferredoxin-thioredoxin reductase catalytic domain-containing protein [Thermodesulfovibrionales bacterium]|nr:ferredoxin-thioredoxin reductase catalytic domain-containing protein [Thermodesulfovibrionales bacterium]